MIYFLLIFAFGCKSTKDFYRVKPKELTFYSSNDERSTIGPKRETADVESLAKKQDGVIVEKPTTVRDFLNLAQLNLVQGKFAEAEGFARKALYKDLKNSDAQKVLAQVAIKQKKYDIAKLILSKIAVRDKEVFNMRGIVSYREGFPNEALVDFREALKLDTDYVPARMNLGVSYIGYRQMSMAAVEFERVLKVMPSHNDAKLHLAVVKASIGEAEAAAAFYKSVLSDRPGNPLALFNYAVLQKNMGLYDDALDSLKSYLKTDYGKTSKNDEVIKLIDDIQGRLTTGRDQSTDEEIQSLAAEVRRNVGEKIEIKTSRVEESKVQEKEETPVANPTEEPMVGDDISTLERALEL